MASEQSAATIATLLAAIKAPSDDSSFPFVVIERHKDGRMEPIASIVGHRCNNKSTGLKTMPTRLPSSGDLIFLNDQFFMVGLCIHAYDKAAFKTVVVVEKASQNFGELVAAAKEAAAAIQSNSASSAAADFHY